MDEATQQRSRIDATLRATADGLRPWIEGRYADAGDWSGRADWSDHSVVFAALDNDWNALARGWFGSRWRTVRGHVGELRDARNAWAHSRHFGDDDVERIVDTAARLLTAIAESAFTAGRDEPVTRRPSEAEVQAAIAARGRLVRPPVSTPLEPLPPPAVTPGEPEETYEDPRELVGQAVAARRAGDLQKAMRCALRAVTIDPANIYALNALGGIQRALHRLSDAEQTARACLDANSHNNEPASVLLASVLADRRAPDELDEALTICDAVLAQNPSNDHAANLRARVVAMIAALRRPAPDSKGADDNDIPF